MEAIGASPTFPHHPPTKAKMGSDSSRDVRLTLLPFWHLWQRGRMRSIRLSGDLHGWTQVLVLFASYHLCSCVSWIWFLFVVRLGCAIYLVKTYASYPLSIHVLLLQVIYLCLSLLAWFVEVRGSFTFANHVLNIVLSSNTKKGEIERTFLSLWCFDVCWQHNEHSNVCAKYCRYPMHTSWCLWEDLGTQFHDGELEETGSLCPVSVGRYYRTTSGTTAWALAVLPCPSGTSRSSTHVLGFHPRHYRSEERRVGKECRL